MCNQASSVIDGFPSTLAEQFLSGVCVPTCLFAREHVNLTKLWRRPAGSQLNSRMRLCSQLFRLRLFGDPDLCTLPWRHLPSISLSFLRLSASLSVCLHFPCSPSRFSASLRGEGRFVRALEKDDMSRRANHVAQFLCLVVSHIPSLSTHSLRGYTLTVENFLENCARRGWGEIVVLRLLEKFKLPF